MVRLVAIAVLMVATVAHADRRAAEQLWKDGDATHDLTKYDACGRAYVELFDQDPTAPDGDEVLFDAGACFERGRSIGAAEQSFARLRAMRPTSKLVAKAIVHLARIAEARGRFADAAQLLEAYARRYAGERDAPDALREAFAFRMITSDDAAAVAVAKDFARAYGAKRKPETAELMFAVVPSYERQGRDAAIGYLRELLKSYGHELDDARQVIAMAKLGELLWDRTCKGRALCVTELPGDRVPRCADGVRLRVDRRSSTAEAEVALVAAVRQFEQRQLTDPAARHAYAMAKLRIADRALEAYLALAFPVGLDFSPEKQAVKETSTKRFTTWFEARTKLEAVARQRYEEVLVLRDPQGAVAAEARLGQLVADSWATLRTAEIPKDVRRGELAKDRIAAFCDKLTEVAAPFRGGALEAFGSCRARAAELGLDDAWTALCRRGAVALDPRQVVDEPLLPALTPAYPPPPYAPAPRPTPQDPAAYATLLATVEATPGCPPIADQLRPLRTDGARYLAALVAARCGHEDEARRGWEALASPAALASLGSLRWIAGDGKGAIEAWERAVRLDAKLAAPHHELALARFDDAARERDVEAGLLSARIADPDARGPQVMLGLLALRRGQPALAGRYLFDGTADGASLQIARAMLLAQEGRWADAVAPLEAAAREHAPQAGHDLALVALHQHRYQEAADRLGGERRSYDVLVAQGVAFLGLGKPAEPTLRAAIALDAARPEAHFDLGLALAAQQKFADAAVELDLAKATGLADRYRKL